ncbi:TPA: LPXTG cell wall anchor domain-containing protein [Streptococcus suis]|uniref:LPXTG cell wall anchor domain-containing protein n=4 Tax=Streptococcus suis TaxID=1307 RepID=UPI0009CC24F4|nr:LPXTG cell wall anchor domain-containing protein [Streptococcus suis]MBS8090305.1 LPXTG cell wall anchor domain-containing protein [Streptococcus suis]MCH1663850.1 LPXTG cell wall anchor domain-containing protein [Streptococcus suis]MCK3900558.1 LPXTG cell wall anchor domain-containing protein [Streptococcus suis]MCK3940579.1 LPXTG cell wall anchor domain-containing protein [Streptococcus suis]MCK3946941.1 LPXTG cell wall anchor domain-containing protein [Streptococcus suis]
MSKQKVVSSLLLSTVVLGGLAFYSTTTVKAESLEPDVTSVSSSDATNKLVVSNEEESDFLAEEELEESDAPVETLNEEIKDVTEPSSPEALLQPRAMMSDSMSSGMEEIQVKDEPSDNTAEKVVKQQSDLIQSSSADSFKNGKDKEKLESSVSIDLLSSENNEIKWKVSFDTSAWSFNYHHGGLYFILPEGLNLKSVKANTNDELFNRFPNKVDSTNNGDGAPFRFFNKEENSDSFNNQWGWSAGQAPNEMINNWKTGNRFSKIYFIDKITDTRQVTYTLTASVTDSNQKSFPLVAVMKSFWYTNSQGTQITSLAGREITLEKEKPLPPKETPAPEAPSTPEKQPESPKEDPKKEDTPEVSPKPEAPTPDAPKQDVPETPDKQPEEMPKVPEAPKEDAPAPAPSTPSVPEEKPKEDSKPEVPSAPEAPKDAPSIPEKQPDAPQVPLTPEEKPQVPEAPKQDDVQPDAPQVPEAPKEEVPTPPAPSVPEEQPKETPTPEVPKQDDVQPEAPKSDKVETDKQMPETKQPDMKQPKADDMPKEQKPKADEPKVEQPQMEAPKKDSEAPKSDKVESDKQLPETKQPDMKQPKADDMPKEQKPKADEPKAEQPQMEAPKKDSEAPKSDKVETDKPMPETKQPDMKQPKADKPEAEKAQMPRTEGMKPESKASMMPKAEAPKATLPNTGEASSAIGWLGGALATLATGLYLFKNKKEE